MNKKGVVDVSLKCQNEHGNDLTPGVMKLAVNCKDVKDDGGRSVKKGQKEQLTLKTTDDS